MVRTRGDSSHYRLDPNAGKAVAVDKPSRSTKTPAKSTASPTTPQTRRKSVRLQSKTGPKDKDSSPARSPPKTPKPSKMLSPAKRESPKDPRTDKFFVDFWKEHHKFTPKRLRPDVERVLETEGKKTEALVSSSNLAELNWRDNWVKVASLLSVVITLYFIWTRESKM